jgi:hypothetical protein
MTRGELAAVLLGVALIIGGGVAVFQRVTAPAPLPPEVVAIERALAMPGLLALATVDVASVVEVERRFDAEAAPSVADEEGIVTRILAEAGLDPRRDLRFVSAAARLGEGGEPAYAVALLGSIDAAAFTRALESSPLVDVQRVQSAAGAYLRVVARDPRTCEPSRPWAVHVEGSRILASDAPTLEKLLARLGQSEPPGRDLSRFRTWRDGRLAAAALFVPETLPGGIDDPLLAAPAEIVRSELEAFDGLYVAAGTRWLPPAAVVSAMLEGSDPALAEQAAARWREAVERARERVEASSPTVAALCDSLDIGVSGGELQASVHIDAETARRLGELPGELMGMLLGGVADGTIQAPATVGGEERIAQNPAVFVPSYTPEALPAYDPSAPFAGAVDSVAGPFGLRVDSLALPAEPARSGPEISIRALAPRLANLGDHPGRAQLRVTSAAGPGGEELLREEVCGAHRNGSAVGFESGLGQLIQAAKVVRLRPGARAGDVERLAGRISLRLPLQTRTVVLGDPEDGDSAEAGGTRVELTGVEARGVHYRIVGDAERVLALRALNAAGAPLENETATAMESPFGRGRSGSKRWAGQVASLEVVFATEERLLEFPFEIEPVRPGSEGERIGANDLGLVEYSRSRLLRDFRAAFDRTFAAHEQPRALAHTGPFLVALERLWSFGGLMPRFQVHAPEIPNLEHSLSALEIALEEVRLRDGSVRRAGDPTEEGVSSAGAERARQWAEILSMGRPLGEPGLRGDANLETGAPIEAAEVAGLSGNLILRVPRRIATLSLPDAALGSSASGGGVSVTLAGLARDRFTLRADRGGEKVLGVRAYNERGDELVITRSHALRDPSGWRAEFGVAGSVRRIDVIVAPELDRIEYPFGLTL